MEESTRFGEAKKTKMPNTDVRHPFKYHYSATVSGPKYSNYRTRATTISS